jgi:RNA polymerase sigma factor (sigma-70 family)
METKKDVELLYGDDKELFVLMNSGRSKNRWGHFADYSVEDEVLINIFLEEYYEALSKLPEQEQQVLLKYYDENGIHSVKTKDIGLELNITESKVYTLKAKALKKLSRNPRLKSYKEEQNF